jgi:hypothetical protein
MQTTTHQGYDYYAYHKRKDPPKPNGWLRYNGDELPLWVFDVTTDFAMAGTTAQSRRTRTFFAHNFQQPAISVSVQLPSQAHLGKLAEFVRTTHLGMDSNTRLEIIAGWPTTSQNMKGPHQNIVAEGYVKTIPREHMKQVWAPELTFQFIVEKMISPAGWADSPVTVRRLKSWHDIVAGIMANSKGRAFVDDPDANRPDPSNQSATPGVPGTVGTRPH